MKKCIFNLSCPELNCNTCQYYKNDIEDSIKKIHKSIYSGFKLEKKILAKILWFLMFIPMLIAMGLNFLREKLEDENAR